MDRYAVRKLVENCFLTGGKYKLSKELSPSDMSHLIDVLWEYVETSEDANIYKRELEELRRQVAVLKDKSGQRVRCIKVLPNRRALVQLGPIKEEIIIAPEIDTSKLKTGTEVFVMGSGPDRILAGIRDHDIYDGRLSKVQRVLDNERIIVDDGGHEIILKVADWVNCKKGDEIRYDLESQMVLEVFGSNEEKTFSLADTPDVCFNDVKGLDEEKKYLKERLIYPILHKEKFEKYGLQIPRAVLFHGVPGCGKSMLGGAVFNEMLKIRKNSDIKGKNNIDGFYVVNGPSVLDKWVGNTEKTIKNLFDEARKTSITTGFPSVIFWDEIDSVAGKRKDSATYTPEKTIVPTLLTEIQGLNHGNGCVVLICATNRPALLDPALLRPGRLGDLIIEIPRPNDDAAKDILNAKFQNCGELLSNLISDGLVEKIVNHIYNSNKPIAIATLKSGKKVPLMRQEQVSGALFAQLGEEVVRSVCISDIQGTKPIIISDVIELVDNIMLNQIGILDAGVKSGFTFNTDDYVLDVSLDS